LYSNLSWLEGLVIFEGMKVGGSQQEFARAWLLRPDGNRRPVRLATAGETSRLTVAWAWALDPGNGEVVMFAEDGVFRISVECG
jgi:hypothetical protein